MLGIFSWHTLVPLVPPEDHLNTTVNLSIVPDHAHDPLYPQCTPVPVGASTRITCHVTKVKGISWTWQRVHCTKLFQQSTDLSTTETCLDVVELEIHTMDVQMMHLQQNWWWHHVNKNQSPFFNLCHEAKGGPTHYCQGLSRKEVASDRIKILMILAGLKKKHFPTAQSGVRVPSFICIFVDVQFWSTERVVL